MENLVIGAPENSCANFRVMIHFLANDPLYGRAPLSLFTDLDYAMQSGRVLCARNSSGIVGVACWKYLTDDRAKRAIQERQPPTGKEILAPGNAVLLTLTTGSVKGAIFALTRNAILRNRGRIILYERHLIRGEITHRFGWVDKAGVLNGKLLD